MRQLDHKKVILSMFCLDLALRRIRACNRNASMIHASLYCDQVVYQLHHFMSKCSTYMHVMLACAQSVLQCCEGTIESACIHITKLKLAMNFLVVIFHRASM